MYINYRYLILPVNVSLCGVPEWGNVVIETHLHYYLFCDAVYLCWCLHN